MVRSQPLQAFAHFAGEHLVMQSAVVDVYFRLCVWELDGLCRLTQNTDRARYLRSDSNTINATYGPTCVRSLTQVYANSHSSAG